MFYKIFLPLLLVFYTVGAAEIPSKHDTRVINGTTVSTNNPMWKFIVTLEWQGRQYCGGSLIAPNWVLTAAHCLSDNNGNPYTALSGDTVGVGSYDQYNTTSYAVKRFIVHPAYNSTASDNDIALIELAQDITTVPTIPYDVNHALTANTPTRVAGWGNTNTTTAYYPKYLREALVPIVDSDTCNSPTSYNGYITNNMICAGYMDGRRDGCQGDSGGPLIVDNTLVGVVSWGNGCAQVNFPGVYTKVQNYATWIASYVPKLQKYIPIMMDDIMIIIPAKE